MQYLYRPMQEDDYDGAYALWRRTPGMGLSDADSRDNIVKYLRANPDQSFVCLYGDEIIGTILCGSDGRRAYIHHTAVCPPHRRRGVARELVRLALAAQKQRGIVKCHLFIFGDNAGGHSFWESEGFTLRRDVDLMSKEL